ncbi:MAG: alpha-ketoacid dehydrogenase subunit beta [Armatimonadetes bacterium]|nr:alpha-ketoacid dehydrogenase subunit beta [Armatimonadota bacterium]
MREIFYSHAIREAIAEEMERDPSVFMLGEDIAEYGGAFKVTQGLSDRFGKERIRNTPISENSFVGVATGAALLGFRPIVDIMFQDFITLAMDQITNHATKIHYMYGGQMKVPLVIRTPAGGGRCYGPTHSQSLEAWFMHIPGLKVAAPATAYDAKGMLKSAIRDDNPVVFVESKLLYGQKGPVPEEEYLVPLGEARVIREGEDVTLIAYSRMTVESEKAARVLEQEGISCEVLDLRTLAPLDMGKVSDSVVKTGRAVIVEEGCLTNGVGAEVSARITESCFDYLNAPIRRVAALDVPVPCADSLERAALPDAGKIVTTVRRLLEQYS